ncbi:MAG TPA: hypothetical protein VIW70_11750 [Rubrivivax sp.]
MELRSLAAGCVEFVILFTLIEGLALTWWFRRSGRGVPPREFLANMVSGVCLMLALHGALTQSAGWSVMTWLAAAGLAHGTDLWRRWRRENAA